MNRKILISYFRKNEANSRLTMWTHWKELRELFIYICEKHASNSSVGLYTHRKVKITQFHNSKYSLYSKTAEIYV